jgi:hypothetical protein
MNAEDMAMLDRVERLAFQAGVGARGQGEQTEKSEKVKPEVEVVLRKLAQIGRDYPSFTGTAVSGMGDHVLTWEEVVALSKVM